MAGISWSNNSFSHLFTAFRIKVEGKYPRLEYLLCFVCIYPKISGICPTVRTPELYGWMHEQHVVLLLSMRLTGMFAPSFIFSSMNLTFVFADDLSGWMCHRAGGNATNWDVARHNRQTAQQHANNPVSNATFACQADCLFSYFVWPDGLWASYLDVSERSRYNLMRSGVSVYENVSEWASELVQWLPW